MAKKIETTKESHTGMKVALVGASLAGLAAGAYFFLGPKGKKHQRQAKSWAIKMKGEVVEKLENAQEVSQEVYHDIIDNVAAKYLEGKNVAEDEVTELATDLKKHWKTLTAGKAKKKTAKK